MHSSRDDTVTAAPTHDEIRDYANHLYRQRGCVDGHDKDDWIEAEVCLTANIPKDATRPRAHEHNHHKHLASHGSQQQTSTNT